MKTDWSLAEQLKASHGREWSTNWQYATVWRFGPPGDADGFPEAPLPFGENTWELNVDYGDGGYSVTTPKWSDGTTVQYAVHYRRPYSGMFPAHVKAHLHEQRERR